MLKLTKKLEYALIALRHIKMKQDVLSSAKEISTIYIYEASILPTDIPRALSAVSESGGLRLHQHGHKISNARNDCLKSQIEHNN